MQDFSIVSDAADSAHFVFDSILSSPRLRPYSRENLLSDSHRRKIRSAFLASVALTCREFEDMIIEFESDASQPQAESDVGPSCNVSFTNSLHQISRWANYDKNFTLFEEDISAWENLSKIFHFIRDFFMENDFPSLWKQPDQLQAAFEFLNTYIKLFQSRSSSTSTCEQPQVLLASPSQSPESNHSSTSANDSSSSLRPISDSESKSANVVAQMNWKFWHRFFDPPNGGQQSFCRRIMGLFDFGSTLDYPLLCESSLGTGVISIQVWLMIGIELLKKLKTELKSCVSDDQATHQSASDSDTQQPNTSEVRLSSHSTILFVAENGLETFWTHEKSNFERIHHWFVCILRKHWTFILKYETNLIH